MQLQLSTTPPLSRLL
jgi:hypothetical protein